MTNTSSATNMGWEVAGGKKVGKKPAEINAKSGKESNPSKFPKQENLQPIKLEKTLFEYIRESDDESNDMDELNNNKAKGAAAAAAAAKAKKEQIPNGSTSPRGNKTAAKAQQPNQEPINLLASSMVANQKKKTTSSSSKSPEQEVEATIGQMRLEDLERESTNLQALYPGNWFTVNLNLAIFLNQYLSHIADFDPSSAHENETTSLLSKAENKVVKFLNGTVSRLSRVDAQKLFETLFQALFADPNKSPSNHGYKIFIQLVVKHANLGKEVDSDLTQKVNELLANNKHRHQRCLIALWALSQLGYTNFTAGLKIWFDCMLAFLNTKGSTQYVANYPSALLSHHNVGKDTTARLIDLDQYSRLFDLVSDKNLATSTGKDAANRLKQAHALLRASLVRDMSRSPADYFELMLGDLKTESSPKQDDLLDMIANLVLHNHQLLDKWKQIYSKNVGPSLVLLERLSSKHLREFKRLKSVSETMRFMDEHSSSLLDKAAAATASSKETSKSGAGFYQKNKSAKSSELDLLKKFNRLVKQLISDHFRRTSRFSMVLRSMLIVSLVIGGFFYWDINVNKSVYTNSIQAELKKYGLLEPTLKLINSVKNLAITIQSLLAHYIPIWYKKFNQTVVPAVINGWNVATDYANIAWVRSGPYREMLIVYINQGVDFIHENFPYVMKNLISVVQLAINYATTLFNFVMYYVFIGIDFVGIQLLGWKKGDLEKVFLDAIKVSMEYLSQLFQKLAACK